jgi:hypothetical protein
MKNKTDSEDSMPALPSAAEQEAEKHRLDKVQAVCDLLEMNESTLRAQIEGACSELDREQGVRERCYPNWIKDGKVSKIDATDRFLRMKYAQEIMHFLLDIFGASPRLAGDDVPF